MLISNKQKGAFLAAIALLCVCGAPVEAKRSKKNAQKAAHALRCQSSDECQMNAQHFALYSSVKRALDSEFDVNGKELVGVLRAVDVLRRRHERAPTDERFAQPTRNGSDALVTALLADQRLRSAMNTFQSDDGRALLDLYKSSMNGGRGQSLSCSHMRLDDIERAARKLDASAELTAAFARVHKRFVRKSAKKCLKRACNSIDESMSKLDSVLGKQQTQPSYNAQNSALATRLPLMSVSSASSDQDTDQITTTTTTDSSIPTTTTTLATPSKQETTDSSYEREFEREEHEFCRFIKRQNSSAPSECRVSGDEMNEISLINVGAGDSIANELLIAYYNNFVRTTPPDASSPSQSDLDATRRIVLARSCRPMRALLDYNLAALKWYRKQDLIEEQRLASRTFWCPSLSYWLQVDRLCNELESTMAAPTTTSTPTQAPTTESATDKAATNKPDLDSLAYEIALARAARR